MYIRLVSAAILTVACGLGLVTPTLAQGAASAGVGGAGGGSAGAIVGSEPARVKALVIGVLKWQSRDLSSFDSHNRADAQLCAQLEKMGVPKSQITYLPDSRATLANIQGALQSTLTSCQPGDTFVFYYCGHGWIGEDGGGYFANYDAGDDEETTCLSTDEIAETFNSSFRGKQALFLADCCRSGALINSIQSTNTRAKFGAIAAAVAGQDSTGNWTFTEAVLDALKGHNYADFDRDGKITFAELARYIGAEMKVLEGQKADSSTGNGFDPNLVVSHVVNPKEPIPQRVEVKYEGEWYKAKLMEVKDGQGRIRWLDIGWDAPEDDSWVALADVKYLERAQPVVSNAVSGTSAAPPSAPAVSKYAINQKVQVNWQGEWYPASILKVEGGKYFVHYDGYEASDDEWVEPKRIR